MATTLLTIADITKEAVAILHEELQLAKIANRKYEDRFGKKSGQIGTKVSIRKPPKYAVGTTADISALDGESIEDYVDLTCTTRRNIKMVFSSQDLTLKINDFSKQFVRPAISRLAREIDLVGFASLKVSPQSRITRTSSTAISFLNYTLMNAKLDANLAPNSDRTLFASSVDHAYVVDGNKGLFQSAESIKEQYIKGYMGTSGGFDWVATQNVPTITFGAVPALTGTAAALTEGATTVAVSAGTASGVIKAGQAFTISDVYAIDPETQTARQDLYTFIVASDVTLAVGGTGTVTFAAPVYTTATNRTQANISSLGAGTGTIVFVDGPVASTSGNLVFGIQKDALALGVISLEVPGGVDMASQENFEGIGLRIIRSYDVVSDNWTCRIDTQFGWATNVRPECVVSAIGKCA